MAEKNRRKPGSMFNRCFSMTTAVALFCIVVAGGIMFLFFVNFWKNDRLQLLSAEAQRFSKQISARGASEPVSLHELPPEALEYLQQQDTALFVTDTDGNILLCREQIVVREDGIDASAPCAVHAGMSFPASLILEAAARYPETASLQTRLPGFAEETGGLYSEKAQYLLSAAAVYLDGECCGAVVAMQTVRAALPYTAELGQMLLVTGLFAVLFAFLVSVIASYRMVRPLKTITAAIKKYADGDFSERIGDRDNYSELADLIASFNSMAENLARIDASRSSFVANISHELKTPMTIISGFIDGILDNTIPEEDRQRYLKIVSDETKQLSRLVVSMLNMSRIEAGQLQPVLSDVALDTLIRKSLVSFEMAIRDKEITVYGEKALTHIVMQADETLFHQIFYNLIDNAVKFTPYGGKIWISLAAEKKQAVIRLKNTGRGIPPEERELIFDRFYKVDKSRGLDAKSFGMGLYIVKSIIELHGGTISVDSVREAYTEFTIRLPLERENFS